ncbi:MAG: HypC/HybG/HupF family hydrogenase formation chaperone [Candidatus Ratteibacteria bacterium]|jgi:hydrogenase expression/formation protein HypC
MCLAVIGKIIEIRKPVEPDAFPQGLVEVFGIKRTISFGLLPSAAKDDYVLIHAGFAIQKLEPKDAKKTLKLLKANNG